jgi:hypothetical protein
MTLSTPGGKRQSACRRPSPISWLEVAGLSCLIAWEAFAFRLSRRHYLSLPMLQAPVVDYVAARGPSLPVSAIIPARNEAHNLPALLNSLQAQQRGAAELIVVDDRSGDDSAAIAARAGAMVVASPGPPRGWTGKNYACHLGAQAAGQPWLLFLDADTALEPHAIETVLDYVQDRQLDGLSLLLAQHCLTFWERLLLPYAYALYFIGAGPSSALANGQWILLSSEAYTRCGGHAAVRGSITDDIALARACKRVGVDLRVVRGEQLARVRMYDSLGSIWEGFSKNAFQFVAAQPRDGILTVGGALAGGALPTLGWRAWRHGGVIRWCAMLAAYATMARGIWFWQRAFNAGRCAALLYPLAALVFQAIALNSAARVIFRRGVTWKGRQYR